MSRPQPRPTRTDTLFTDPTLFRSPAVAHMDDEARRAKPFQPGPQQRRGFEVHRENPPGRPGKCLDAEALGPFHHVAGCKSLERHVEMLGRRAKARSEEHTSELQSLMRHSYAVFCLTKKNQLT